MKKIWSQTKTWPFLIYISIPANIFEVHLWPITSNLLCPVFEPLQCDSLYAVLEEGPLISCGVPCGMCEHHSSEGLQSHKVITWLVPSWLQRLLIGWIISNNTQYKKYFLMEFQNYFWKTSHLRMEVKTKYVPRTLTSPEALSHITQWMATQFGKCL